MDIQEVNSLLLQLKELRPDWPLNYDSLENSKRKQKVYCHPLLMVYVISKLDRGDDISLFLGEMDDHIHYNSPVDDYRRDCYIWQSKNKLYQFRFINFAGLYPDIMLEFNYIYNKFPPDPETSEKWRGCTPSRKGATLRCANVGTEKGCPLKFIEDWVVNHVPYFLLDQTFTPTPITYLAIHQESAH